MLWVNTVGPITDLSPPQRYDSARCRVQNRNFGDGLLPQTDELLQVGSNDSIGTVVGQLHRWGLRSCIVDFNGSHKEFFECDDFQAFLLKALGGSTATVEENWEVMKRKLREIAAKPVRDALRALF